MAAALTGSFRPVRDVVPEGRATCHLAVWLPYPRVVPYGFGVNMLAYQEMAVGSFGTVHGRDEYVNGGRREGSPGIRLLYQGTVHGRCRLERGKAMPVPKQVKGTDHTAAAC